MLRLKGLPAAMLLGMVAVAHGHRVSIADLGGGALVTRIIDMAGANFSATLAGAREDARTPAKPLQESQRALFRRPTGVAMTRAGIDAHVSPPSPSRTT